MTRSRSPGAEQTGGAEGVGGLTGPPSKAQLEVQGGGCMSPKKWKGTLEKAVSAEQSCLRGECLVPSDLCFYSDWMQGKGQLRKGRKPGEEKESLPFPSPLRQASHILALLPRTASSGLKS